MMADNKISRNIRDVAFILYNYTTKLLLKKQLDFFRKSALSFSFSLTVVDDASLDGSRELLGAFPEVTPVFLGSSQGVGRAFNRGLAATLESRYVCLLHTDVNLNVGVLEALLQHCDTHQDVKICAPIIRFPWRTVQKFVFVPSLLAMYSGSADKSLSKSVAKKLNGSQHPVRVAGIIGPFLFCSRDLVIDNKLYDEEYWHYFCDIELAHRLQRQGVVCEVLPGCSLVRLGGQTSFIRNPETYFSMKHKYVRKYYGQRHAVMSLRRDMFKAWFKVFSYRVWNWLIPSSKLRFQIERYEQLRVILEQVKLRSATLGSTLNGNHDNL